MPSLIAAALLATSLFADPLFAEMPAAASPRVASRDVAVDVAKAAGEMFEGRVVLATKSALTIVAKNGDNVMFAIAADCKVTRDGKPSSAEMLGAGDRVMIAASTEAGRNIANTITARGPERPAR